MAEIIQFGDKRKEASNSSASAAALAFKTQTIDDWGNQELADLYRVKRLLEQAGVYVETDRGVTDEGDPWFVFCHPDGEVFVHLCRFDGQYLLDSTAIEQPLRGTTFTDLINQFVDRAIERRAANIVSLRPGDGVYLHPAIMLTALIWTLFVASDELIGIAHGAEVDNAGADFDVLVGAHIADISDTQGAFGILQAALADQGDDAVFPKAAELEKSAVDQVERENAINGSSTAHANAISLSLSAIAVTFGLTSKSSFDFLQSEREESLDAGTLSLSSSDFSNEEIEFRRLSEESENLSDQQIDLADTASGDDVSPFEQAVEKLAAVLNVPDGVMLQALPITNVNTSSIDIADIPSVNQPAGSGTAVISRARVETASKEPEKKSEENAEVVTTEVSTIAQLGKAFEFDSDLTLKSFVLDDHEVFASFDISTEQGQSWLASVVASGDIQIHTDVVQDGPKTNGTIRATTVTEYSENAINFVKYLLSKSDTVEVIALKGKIVLVDISAFDDVNDVSYLRNWTHEDVGVISTIGHLSDFEAFGLVVA